MTPAQIAALEWLDRTGRYAKWAPFTDESAAERATLKEMVMAFALPRVSEQSELLEALAARCEREGPSDALNKAIYVAMGFCLHEKTTYSGAQSDMGFTCDDCGADSWGNLSKNGKNQKLHGKPMPYTTSLDAAVTLVPEGWVFTINTFPKTASAYVMNAEGGIVRPKENHIASPALALCAAALRARAVLAKAEGL